MDGNIQFASNIKSVSEFDAVIDKSDKVCSKEGKDGTKRDRNDS